MDRICGDAPFWDENLTWRSDWPQFTSCFQYTVLVWGPCAFLWITSLFYVYYLTTKPSNPMPFSRLFVAKLFTCGILFILRTVQMANMSITSQAVIISACIVYDVTLVLIILLMCLEKKKGVVTSPLLFAFWFISLTVDIIPFYSKIKLKDYQDGLLEFLTFYLSYGLAVVNFILQCFAEKIPPGSWNTNGNPEVAASTLSRMTFWWINRLVIQGYKGHLEDGTCQLNPRDLCATIVPPFQSVLQQQKMRYKNQLQNLENSWYLQPNTLSKLSAKAKDEEKTPLLGLKSNNLDSTPSEEELAAKTGSPRKKGGINVFMVVLKTYWWQMLCTHSLMLVYTVAILVNPLVLKLLIEFTEDSSVQTWKGYMYSILMFLLTVIQSLCNHISMFYTNCMAMRISASMVSAVFRKALTINNESRRDSTTGEVVNLMSVDSRNIEMYMTYSFWLWMSPLHMIIALYLLYTILGVSMFAGLAFMIVLFTANTYLMNKLRIYQKLIMAVKDKRIKAVNEVLNGIKILKLFAWEPYFAQHVDDIRKQELSYLLRSSLIDSFLTFAWTAAVYWMTLFTYMTFVYVDDSHYLDASTSFVALSYFNLIRLSINILPIMIREGIKCIVSIGRMNKYLNMGDLDTSSLSHEVHGDTAIKIEGGTYTWNKKLSPVLTDINLEVKRGSLVAVVGSVGVGKSSLVSAMLGEMEAVTGSVNIGGSIAYVPQQSWIQNDTLRNNILFGQKYDERRYDSILQACALKPDLEILAAGDMTEIGEKGINLSGGQKQRVSVARAVYSNADIILLDDPLSAVDSHVGKHMFNHVISDTGLLKGKTRILVTHGLQWLPKVDCIVVLTSGQISEMGSYEQLMSHNGAFAQFLSTYLTEHHQSDQDDEDEEAQSVKRDMLQRLLSVPSENELESSIEELTKSQILKRLYQRQSEQIDQRSESRKKSESEFSSHKSLTSSGQTLVKRQNSERRISEAKKVVPEKSKLIEEEQVESGKVTWGVYMELARALGVRYSILMFALFTVYNLAALGSNLWLSAWTDDKELSNMSLPADSPHRQELNSFYLGVYGGLGATQTIFVFTYSIIMALRHIHASRMLHNKMLTRILRAPMAFFDTTPLGRIVNRFSQDMEMVDTEVCVFIEIWVDNVERVLSTVIAISYSTPIFLAVFLPAFVLYYFVMRFYIVTSCGLRRLQSKKRSPIYSHFGESLFGAPVIRAYGAQQRFIQESEARVDACQTYNYNANGAGRWLGIRLDFLGAIMILAAAVFTVWSRDTLSAGVVGLSLSYAMDITSKLNMVVRVSTEVETNIVSVERISQYTKVPSEAPWTKLPRPPPSWPKEGGVKFEEYSTRYRPGLELVLHELSCHIKPGEKVGIVGRTGAGKSSLTLSLFRLVEAASGRITVDDIDIASLGLHELRRQLTILPQDPVIFDGTLRSNLDPLNLHSDLQIWQALEQAHLKNFVDGLPDKLQHQCGEGGDNLSVGQRQLVCLARTLLRKTKVLVLDEATAAVDMETDDLIQQTIRGSFADCTILTIAHRLNTVLDYDRILVLDAGRVVEFDTPTNLLQNTNSSFYGMAKDAGLVR